ncbi:hypothetical protein ANCCAN_23306 [Ancylostoma caninum]|uniref:Uncharacterized protein n=1 Tax=Ancylostoma caninum TaxID=29170 RepID=A0A368FFS6_ANCCA|nr:hypothetical protein ANCCAN_23306 [Ancylostoma caninum]
MTALEIYDRRNVYKETVVSLNPEAELEVYTRKLLQVVTIMRLNFVKPSHWSTSKVINAVATTIMTGLGKN